MLLSQDQGPVRTLTLDRAHKRNALNRPLIGALTAAVQEAGTQAELRLLVIRGRGPSFSAGVDVSELARLNFAEARVFIRELQGLCRAVRTSPLPVMAVIQGNCIGGAWELALACDFQVALDGACFALPEVLLGIPSVIDAALLQRYVGLGRAREILMLGQPLPAVDAYACGLVNRLAASPESLEHTVRDLIDDILASDRRVMSLQKDLVERWLNLPLDEGIEQSAEVFAEAFRSGVPLQLQSWLDRANRNRSTSE